MVANFSVVIVVAIVTAMACVVNAFAIDRVVLASVVNVIAKLLLPFVLLLRVFWCYCSGCYVYWCYGYGC